MIYKRFSVRFRSGQIIVLSPLGERVKSILFGLFVRRCETCKLPCCYLLHIAEISAIFKSYDK